MQEVFSMDDFLNNIAWFITIMAALWLAFGN
nr:MAG TPA: hypothetical protein [Caudoviricetes sp.]